MGIRLGSPLPGPQICLARHGDGASSMQWERQGVSDPFGIDSRVINQLIPAPQEEIPTKLRPAAGSSLMALGARLAHAPWCDHRLTTAFA